MKNADSSFLHSAALMIILWKTRLPVQPYNVALNFKPQSQTGFQNKKEVISNNPGRVVAMHASSVLYFPVAVLMQNFQQPVEWIYQNLGSTSGSTSNHCLLHCLSRYLGSVGINFLSVMSYPSLCCTFSILYDRTVANWCCGFLQNKWTVNRTDIFITRLLLISSCPL